MTEREATRAILIAVGDQSAPAWVERFRAEAGGRELRVWPDRVGDPRDIAYACTWRAPHGAFVDFPKLRAIFNLGAGVDHLLADPHLPDVPITRAAHPDLTMRMTEYVTLHVLRYHRRLPLYEAQQRERIWRGLDQPAASEVAVGIMGLGVIGADAAQVLARIGFRVAGWSRTPKALPGCDAFAGAASLDAFLRRTEILVCLLPRTPQTTGILNLGLFRTLKRDGALGAAYLVNAGRGALQVDADILAALDQGLLDGATLDVFPTEPLPAESPLWVHPKVTITPHNAGDLAPQALVRSVLAQIAAVERGEPLRNLVDKTRGY